MHSWTGYEMGRLHREEIRQEVAAYHPEKTAQANCGGSFRLIGTRSGSWRGTRGFSRSD